ncbi:MAG: TMEM175 family protein [Lapillicoccus sp.]
MSATSSPAVGPVKGRVEAFSDGVFAVAITLLVLDITLAHKAEPGQLWQDLGGLGYHYAAYAISFLTIGVMWVTHHRLLANVAVVDHVLLYCNLLLLAVIAFIPFPTGILSEYVQGEGVENMRAAVGLYGLTMIGLGVAFTLLWLRVYREPAIRAPEASLAAIRTDLVLSGSATLIYVAGTAIAFFAPLLALIVFAVLVIGFTIAGPRTDAKSRSS